MKVRTVLRMILVAGSLAAGSALADTMNDDPRAANDYLTYHPDLAFRKTGIDAYRHGKADVAADYFRRAARFADKGSQALLAQLYWNGEGVASDHAMAYAWADLAAERGYPSLLAVRENYWRQLDPDEQGRAIADGKALYAEYGDSVAQPRLATQLRRGLHEATGSHLGVVGALKLLANKPSCNNGKGCRSDAFILGNGMPGGDYYAARYWDTQQYYAWQDEIWNAPARHGRVIVGGLQQVPGGPAESPGQLPSDRDSRAE